MLQSAIVNSLNRFKIHPTFLVRFTGGDFDSFDSLSLDQTPRLIQELNIIEFNLETSKSHLSDALFLIVKNCLNDESRRILINLKRDIFNLRMLSKEQSLTLNELSKDHEFEKLLRNYYSQSQAFSTRKIEIEKMYNEEILTSRAKLRLLSQKDNLQCGLLLSSMVFFDEVPNYIKTADKLNKRSNQTELSLIKYLSRIYTKTSPFSTFTNLGLGKIKTRDYGSDVVKFSKIPHSKSKVVSHIMLNNELYKHLKGLILKNYETIKWFKIKLNPTVHLKHEEYHYLAKNNSDESFQRIERNPLLDLIIETIKRSKRGISLENLILRLTNHVDSSMEGIRKHLDSLIDYGMLEIEIGVSGMDPNWDKRLIKVLSKIPEGNVYSSTIKSTLVELRKMANCYSTQMIEERKRTLVEAHQLYIETYNMLKENSIQNNETSLNKENFTFKKAVENKIDLIPEKMFYEDTTLEIFTTLKSTTAENIAQSLHSLLVLLKFSDNLKIEQFKLASYFKSRYPTNAKIDLLSFYESYSKEFKGPENEFKKAMNYGHKPDLSCTKLPSEIWDSEFMVNRRNLLQNWKDALSDRIKSEISMNNDNINLTAELLSNINNSLLIEKEDSQYQASFSAMIQYDNKLGAVVNVVAAGNGKIFSRFLHLFKKTVHKDIVRSSIEMEPSDSIFIENTDSSFFNANIHPPLLGYEICSPESSNMLDQKKQIPITDLLIRLDDSGQRLLLIHKETGKKIYVFDLGFESTLRRSPLFQFLSYFPQSEYLSFNIITKTINKCYEGRLQSNSIIIHPRIIFESNIIIQKKAWIIPREFIPAKDPLETEANYFSKLLNWVGANGLPTEGFLQINFELQNSNIGPTNNGKQTRDDYKPQYINFKNPFLVKLFIKLISRASLHIKIVEVLPSFDNLSKINDRRLVTEYMIQWQGQI